MPGFSRLGTAARFPDADPCILAYATSYQGELCIANDAALATAFTSRTTIAYLVAPITAGQEFVQDGGSRMP